MAKFRPKWHYIEHYPEAIKRFGPLVNCCTIRYEAKHFWFKRTAQRSLNYKNITLTLARKHQMYQTLFLSGPTFFKPLIDVKNCSALALNLYSQAVQTAINGCFDDKCHVMEATKGTVNYQEYRQGMFLVHGHVSGLPEFCKIHRLLFHRSNAFFLCQHYSATFEDHYARYNLEGTNAYHILNWNSMDDYYPLHGYNVNGRLYVVPKRLYEPLDNETNSETARKVQA